MSIETTEITAVNQFLTDSRDEPARKRTEITIMAEPDLDAGGVLSLQVKAIGESTWRTIKLVAAASLTAGEHFVYSVSLAGSWNVRFGCTTFAAGDTPVIYLAVESF